MANNSAPLEQLKSFLNQLFQFDSQDLDFGVYKILHYKKKEIANFIDQLLVDKVKAELQTLSADEAKQVKDQIAEMEQSTSLKKWLEAVQNNDETRLVIYEEDYKEEIAQYKELKAKATESSVSVETENQIYNHLTLFFSRYYDKGDFISKRRFGKNEKYVVPYNGEETHFHWANQDQYYIKSSETFNQYAFKVPTSSGEIVINFKLTDAQIEQGNVKENDKNYFILSDKEAEVGKEEATFFFEYRPMTAEEKEQVKGNSKQDTLDEQAYAHIKEKQSKNALLVKLWEAPKEGKPLLLKKLHHYTRKNKHDFFIHKNLKGFLERELDYYIKSELVNVDDLYVTDTDTHFDRLKHNLKTIKVFKSIADTIIDFVSQIEDFQKKLWEKKKFVLSTEWVITFDRLVEYVGEDAAQPILEEVIKNEKQVAEWKDLFGVTDIGKKDERKKLPIDTKHFSTDFKYVLLNTLSNKIDISSSSDCIAINSDNFHGIQTIHQSFNQSVDLIYIDPPYNTEKDRVQGKFIYKDGFSHSSWLTLMNDRFEEAFDLMSSKGVLIESLDENEYSNQKNSVSKLQYIGTLILQTATDNNPTQINTEHEYILFFARNKENLEKWFGKSKGAELIIDEYNRLKNIHGDNIDDIQKGLRKWIKNNLDKLDKVSHYDNVDSKGVFHDDNVANTRFGGYEYDVIHPVTKKVCKIPDKGYRYPEETMRKLISENEIMFGKNETTLIKPKKRIENVKDLLRSLIYEDGRSSTKRFESMFGKDKFPNPKSDSVLSRIFSFPITSKKSVILDYFAGSGTTFQSIQQINLDDNASHKCILIEQGGYFYEIIIPRIKKIAYTFDWKDGKPKDDSMNGLGVFFKYQRLEQYEEALENIAFNASENAVQKALKLDTYIPKYFLEFETKGSQTLVNIAAMKDPWDYKLKVWDGFTYDTEHAVDLVETFNYLIGLHMQKCITKELNGKKYQFIYGHNNANKNILVVWRSVKDWSIDDFKADAAALKTELKAFEYDLLYINDQAHIEGYQPIEEVFKNKMLP